MKVMPPQTVPNFAKIRAQCDESVRDVDITGHRRLLMVGLSVASAAHLTPFAVSGRAHD